MDTVTEPQQVKLPVTIRAKSQGVPPSQSLISLTILKQHFTLAHPQEDPCTRATHVGVERAGADQIRVEFRLAAIALRAQHLSAHQTHGGGPDRAPDKTCFTLMCEAHLRARVLVIAAPIKPSYVEGRPSCNAKRSSTPPVGTGMVGPLINKLGIASAKGTKIPKPSQSKMHGPSK
uniref:Uncharacterized protein n=1 Tax=Timema douglasi TaxID=61478 RepID=A0A7R8VY62_TIMDO|nr:unnamed protein product [Timema douglasi]